MQHFTFDPLNAMIWCCDNWRDFNQKDILVAISDLWFITKQLDFLRHHFQSFEFHGKQQSTLLFRMTKLADIWWCMLVYCSHLFCEMDELKISMSHRAHPPPPRLIRIKWSDLRLCSTRTLSHTFLYIFPGHFLSSQFIILNVPEVWLCVQPAPLCWQREKMN